MIPDLRHIVEQCKAKHPEAWRNAHTGNAHTEDFIRFLAPMLKAVDRRFALNGKRGNPNDISDDAVNVLCEAEDSDGRTPEGHPCAVIDVIGSAGAKPPYTPGNPAPFVTWQVYRTLVEGSGANVDPAPPPPPPPPAIKPRQQFYDEFRLINAFYMAPEGLQRQGGMVIGGVCDSEAMGAWGYDLMLGKTPEQVKTAIRMIPNGEWQQKHPGEQPF